eukprot:gene32129-16652_t
MPKLVKYGTTSISQLSDDLSHWRNLYIAGRMHKPVVTLKEDARLHPVQSSNSSNVRSVVVAALLLLPESFTTQEFLTKVCGLSYFGDIRMGLAEDPLKAMYRIGDRDRDGDYVPTETETETETETMYRIGMGLAEDSLNVERIVAGSLAELESMYLPLLTQVAKGDSGSVPTASTPLVGSAQSPGMAAGLQQISSDDTRLALMRMLPTGLLHHVAQQHSFDVPEDHLKVPEDHLKVGTVTQEEILQAAISKSGGREGCQQMVSHALRKLVWRSSLYQTASNALTAGGGKAFAYLARKMAKATSRTFADAAGGEKAFEHLARTMGRWLRQQPGHLLMQSVFPADAP